MSIYAIGDTHLSLSLDKPMTVFPGWDDYVNRLRENWLKLVGEDDTVVIAGDISWGLKVEQAIEDLAFLDSLPGEKLIMKGNHDYWWQTKKKLETLFEENGFKTLKVFFNNAYRVGDHVLCGSRGWFFDDDGADAKKVLNREAGRLRRSIEAALEKGGTSESIISFLHYPPITAEQKCDEILDVLKEYGIRRCYYAHLHGASHRNAVIGTVDGIKFDLISADYLRFIPRLIEK